MIGYIWSDWLVWEEIGKRTILWRRRIGKEEEIGIRETLIGDIRLLDPIYGHIGIY